MNIPKIVIVGATGLVGQTLLELMAKKDYFSQLIIQGNVFCVATDASIKSKKKLKVFQHSIPLMTLEEALRQKPEIVVMSAGEKVSKEYAKKFLEENQEAWIIDNSPAWRMDEDIALTIPHLNWRPTKGNQIIPVPNCVAIMLATALYPLLNLGLRSASAHVEQSVSGTGKKGIAAWEEEKNSERKAENSPYEFQCFGNIQQAVRLEKGEFYNDEEKKVMNELRKIFKPKVENFVISPSCSRSGTKVGHYARVRVSLPANVTYKRVSRALAMGVLIHYTHEPSDLLSVVGKEYAIVSDLRIDQNSKKGKNKIFEFTVVSDNLLLGAASTALTCMDKIIKRFYSYN